MTDNALARLQSLLRTLFQFDSADLNFGIYRVLNYKRKEIDGFIHERLPDIMTEAFADYAASDRVKLEGEVAYQQERIRNDFGPTAIDADGQVALPFRETPAAQKYQAIREKIASLSVAEDLKNRVYNDLYTFFNRYYEDGDFVSKRRRGREETYAVPYNGEEVLLHWANKDQYYIKTDERLATYRFHAGEFHVAFEVIAAETSANNNKGEKRFYLPAPDPIAWNPATSLLTISIQHRSLTESETGLYGTKGQQDKINAAAVETILAAIPGADLKAALARVPANEETPILRKHLAQFTRRNTLDFFIHKNLSGFLTRELDHFIKNDVLRLDDLLAEHPDALSSGVERARATRAIAVSLIALLAQVEDFQKRLFEKKKFVLRTDYCFTLDRVPEEFWLEVLENKAQLEEWQALYSLDGIMAKDNMFKTGMGTDFLREQPFLMIDTRNFSEAFKWRLLSTLDDLDAATDGLLLNSENFQALNLLVEKYRETVKCIYIDPPYNTAASEILYKNSYKNSSWLSLIADRLFTGAYLMRDDAILCIAIDDYEFSRLMSYLVEYFGETNHLATVAVRSNPHGRAMASGFSPNHEYAIFFGKSENAVVGRLPRNERRLARYPGSDEAGTFAWMNFRATGANSRRSDRPKLFYPVFVGEGGVIRVSPMTWSEVDREWMPTEPKLAGETEVLPIDSDKSERVWNLGWERALRDSADSLSANRNGGVWQIYRKYRPNQEGALPGTWWDDAKYSATESGTRVVKDIIGDREGFSYPKSVPLVEDCLRASACSPGTRVLDFFAGSGTTGHAVINLNREDEGQRKYILVEMGEYFSTVLLPRLKKVVYCPDWKEGKPAGGKGISHTLKVHTLEQYEDTLNNLEVVHRAEDAKNALNLFGDDYLLHYMLDFETRGSASLLDLDQLPDPFDYQLRIKGPEEIRPQPVDLLETFNYLLGLNVLRLRCYDDNGREYRAVLGLKEGKRNVVVWRKSSDFTGTSLARDKAFITDTLLPSLLDEGTTADRLYINSPCAVPGAEAVEPEFKRLMFGETL